MSEQRVVSDAEWLEARRALLAREKELTRQRDAWSRERRALPWRRVAKPYVFDGEHGKKSLLELFAGRSQLLVYHFMFGPDWQEGCRHCSFWADGYDPLVVHLAQRDVTMVAISRAPLPRLLAYRRRMGWTFDWLSSLGNDWNFDFRVSFTAEQRSRGKVEYNYAETSAGEEMPGLSVFCRGDDGSVFHTYSCYARGLDEFNAAYHYLDLVPKGRDEAQLPFPMAWVKRHDEY